MKHLLFGALIILLLTGSIAATELPGKDPSSAKNRLLKKDQVQGGNFSNSGVSSPVDNNYAGPEINPSRGDPPDPPTPPTPDPVPPKKDPPPPTEEGVDPDQDNDEDEDKDRDVDRPIDNL
jgi:hypothetical protein